jgi:GT2 family glycosyltransferase
VIVPNRTRISVILPVHKGGEDFATCLAALAEASPPPNEVIVVVDGDDDQSTPIAQAFRARVFTTPVHGGPAQARNLGAEFAEGDILLFVDADVVVRANTVGQVAALFEQESDLAAVFGSYDDEPAAPNFLSQYKNLFHHFVHQSGREEASTFWSGCGAIRRDLFLALGGFDPGYSRPAIEDIELGYRLQRRGCTVRLCKTLQVKHLKRWDAGSLLRADFFYRALPWTRLILQNRGFIDDLNLRPASRISVVLVYTLLATLAGAFYWPGFLLLTGAAAFLLLILNAPLYRFFLRKRGPWFALRAIPWHWFYYLYSGLAFAIGTVQHLLSP